MPLYKSPKKASTEFRGPPFTQLVVQSVDQADQLLVLVIDGFDADAVPILPLQERHRIHAVRADSGQRKTTSPVSGRKSITMTALFVRHHRLLAGMGQGRRACGSDEKSKILVSLRHTREVP